MTDQTNPAPVVKVTLDSMYQLLLEIRTDVNSMKSNKDSIDDHEQRIRALEKWIWRASGLAALGGAGLGQVFAKFLGN